MSAWTKGLGDAPHDKPIMVRLPTWDCPAVIKHQKFDDGECWTFVEQLLSDIAGGLEPEEVEIAEWAHIPE